MDASAQRFILGLSTIGVEGFRIVLPGPFTIRRHPEQSPVSIPVRI